jgi:hypothetical protein
LLQSVIFSHKKKTDDSSAEKKFNDQSQDLIVVARDHAGLTTIDKGRSEDFSGKRSSRELLNGHSSMVFPEPRPWSPVPFLSDANDANMNNINLPFTIQIFEF